MTRCLQDDRPSTRESNAPAWPRISIVIPSYNQGRFIADAIESVLGQNYGDLELIVMDGGSTDQTVEVLRRYDDRLTDWVSEPDGGQSDAINRGLARTTGDVLGWLCCDDILTDGALATVGRYFAEHADCQWLTGAGEIRYLHTGKTSVGRSGAASAAALREFWRWGGAGALPLPAFDVLDARPVGTCRRAARRQPLGDGLRTVAALRPPRPAGGHRRRVVDQPDSSRL